MLVEKRLKNILQCQNCLYICPINNNKQTNNKQNEHTKNKSKSECQHYKRQGIKFILLLIVFCCSRHGRFRSLVHRAIICKFSIISNKLKQFSNMKTNNTKKQFKLDKTLHGLKKLKDGTTGRSLHVSQSIKAINLERSTLGKCLRTIHTTGRYVDDKSGLPVAVSPTIKLLLTKIGQSKSKLLFSALENFGQTSKVVDFDKVEYSGKYTEGSIIRFVFDISPIVYRWLDKKAPITEAEALQLVTKQIEAANIKRIEAAKKRETKRLELEYLNSLSIA
jgi:hypothetical protein